MRSDAGLKRVKSWCIRQNFCFTVIFRLRAVCFITVKRSKSEYLEKVCCFMTYNVLKKSILE